MGTHSVLQRIAQGDAAAVADCIRRYGGLVWSLARRYLGPEEAEDAVQEIFIDLWKSANRFDAAVASEETFVAMIARRRLIDRGRKRQRQPNLQELPADLSELVSSSPDAEERAMASQIGTLLRELKPEHRRIVTLSLVYGFSHGEIATALGVPLGTVKTTLRRSIQKLRDEMQEPKFARADGGAKRWGGL